MQPEDLLAAQAGVLPAPTGGFPSPTGGFPASPAAQDPLFGVNPYSPGKNMYGLEQPTGIPDLAERAARQRQLMELASVRGLGVPLSSNPTEWTPEEATAQTDNAIAKIATVNPQMAQELAARRAPQGPDEGDSFFDNVKEVAGDLLAPGLQIGGKVLDFVGRTANIVPNIAFDAIDGGDFNISKDVAGAFTGEMRHNWNAVFQEAGWEGGGVGGVLRAGLGLVADIATDPLTWIIPAGAGVKAGEKAAMVAKQAATKSDSVWAMARKTFVDATDDEVTEMLTGRYDALLKGAQAKGWHLGEDLDERIMGLVGTQYKGAEKEMLEHMFTLADRTYRASATKTLPKFLKQGMVDLGNGRSIPGSEVKDVLARIVREGAGTSRASAEWRQARAIASAMGGTRLKLAVPFTRLRYISPAVPGSAAVGQSLSFASRFAAGQSGMNRLLDAIYSNSEDASWEDLTRWMEDGWSAAREANPKLIDELRGRGKNLGSMYYSASEQVGRLTQHFDSAARASRTGLAGYTAQAEEKAIKSAYNNFVRETAYNIERAGGKRTDRQQMLQEMESRLGISLRTKKHVATQEEMLRFAKYLDYFPTGLDSTDPAAIERWFWSLPENADVRARYEGAEVVEGAARPGEAEFLRKQAQLDDMTQVAQSLDAGQRDTLDAISSIWEHARNEGAKKDVMLEDIRLRYDEVGRLVPEQAAQWGAGAHPLLANNDFYMDVPNAGNAQRVRSHGVSDADYAQHDEVTGIRATRVKNGGAASEALGVYQQRVRLRGKDWIVIDETAEAPTSDADMLLAAREEAEAISRQTAAGVDEAVGRPIGTQVSEEEARRASVDMVTEALRKRRPEASGVIYKRADGSVEAVVFDVSNVKAVDPSAAVLAQERGFFHRQFTKEAKEWLRGRPPKEGSRLLVAEPELPAYLKRETAGMTLQEAEDHVRKVMGDIYGEEAAANLPTIWDTNILQVHSDYIDGVATAVASEMTGKAARRFVVLGDLAPAMFGSHPREQKYEWMVPEAILHSLKTKDNQLARAILHANAKTAKIVQEQHQQRARDAETYGAFAAQVEQSLAEGVDMPDRFVQAARRYGKTVAEAESAIGAEEAGLNDRLAQLERQYAEFKEAEAQLGTDPVVGHPGVDDDVAVRQMPDGTQEVKSWHARVEGPVTDIIGPNAPPGDEFTWGGMHVGSFRAAIHRMRGRVEEEFPDAIVGQRAKESDRAEEVLASLAGKPDRKVVRVTHPDGRVTEHVYGGNFDDATAIEQVKYDLFDFETDESQYAFEVFTPEPTHYVDDYAQPVVVRGRIYGLGAGETVPNRDQLAAEFVSDLSSAGAGQGITRRWLKDHGYDGIAYQNSVEDMGSTSIVMLDPGSSVFEAYGPRRLRQLAEDGKLYRAPDGSISGKRVAGSRKLVPDTVAKEGIEATQRRLRELADIRRGLQEGHVPTEGVALAPELAQDASATAGRRTTLERTLGDQSEAAESLGRTGAAVAERTGRQQYAAGRRLERLNQLSHKALGEANKQYAEFHGIKAKIRPALVKVETAGDMKGLTRLTVPGLEGFAMPSYIAEEFHHMVEKHGVNGLRQAWRQYVMGPWKRWATYRWPGFHVRNFFGAFFNNWLGGVVAPDYVFSWRVTHAGDGAEKWAGKKVSAEEYARYRLDRVFGKGYRPTYAEVADRVAEDGVGRANTTAVMGIGEASEAASENYRAVGKDTNAVRRGARRFDNLMRDVGSGIEDFHRVAAWGAGMASTGGDTYGARAFVMMRHGDYADLTGAEDAIRDLVPFYKWTRTNVPYQLRMLAENPGQLTMVADKVKRAAYDAQGLDYEEAQLSQPEWMKQSLAVPIPDWVPVIGSKGKNALKYAMFDLPYADLYNGLNDYMSSTLPVVRNVLESYGFKQTLFSGTPLTGKYKELSGVFNLPGVRDMLSAAGLAQKGRGGKLYIEDKLQNVLMAWPIFSRFRNFTEADPERVDARLGGLFSLMSGVAIKTGDYTQAELDFYYNEVEPLMDQYRSMGVGFPTIDDLQSGEVGSAVGLTNEPPPEGVSPLMAAVAAA
jgi:hypothetical protein